MKENNLKKIKTITLDDNHIYRVNGKVKPSVSEIMKPLSDDYYSNALGTTNTKFIHDRLESRRLLGSAIHDGIETFILFGVYDPEVEDYLKQFKKWLEKEEIEIIHTEQRLTNDIFCGTLDLYVFEQKTGKYGIVDIKATAKINTTLIEVQLAAYKTLAEDNGMKVDFTKSLHIRKKGYSYKSIAINLHKWMDLLVAYEKQEN